MGEPADTVVRSTIVYRYGGALYINLTNRCPTACVFCLKKDWQMQFYEYPLLLKQEPSADDVLRLISPDGLSRDIVFCGFGEPTCRLAELVKIASVLKLRKGGANIIKTGQVRLNTVGLGSLINGRNIVPELVGKIGSVSVSLNTADPEQWVKIHRPQPAFQKEGFNGVVEFIRHCVKQIPETVVTAVDLPDVDIKRCRVLVETLGARFRVRPRLGNRRPGV